MKNNIIRIITIFVLSFMLAGCDLLEKTDRCCTLYYHTMCISNVEYIMYGGSNGMMSPHYNVDGSLQICNYESGVVLIRDK